MKRTQNSKSKVEWFNIWSGTSQWMNEKTKVQKIANLSVSDANGCTTNDVPNIIKRSHFEKSCNNQEQQHTQCLQKKEDTKLITITPSNLNRFSKFFHHWKEISNKNPTTPYVCFYTTLGNLKSQFTEVHLLIIHIWHILCHGQAHW